jgi:hypothetical protein
MRKIVFVLLMFVVVSCFCLSTADATIYFDDGQTHNIDYVINDHVWVDYQSSGMQTTINLLSGGSITGTYDLEAYDNSRINISGGSIGADLRTYDISQVIISGGMIGSYILAQGNSQMTISGGSIGFNLHAYNSSQVTISGGTIGNEILAGTGVGHESVITILGSDFAIDGQSIGYGELTSVLGGHYFNEPSRRLTGTLASGDLIDNVFYIGGESSIVLAPEPAALLLLGLGAVMLRRKR